MEHLTHHFGRESIFGRLIVKLIDFDKSLEFSEQVRRERRELLKLDSRALADIGISREDALREASRPFLDVPEERKPLALHQRAETEPLRTAHCNGI